MVRQTGAERRKKHPLPKYLRDSLRAFAAIGVRPTAICLLFHVEIVEYECPASEPDDHRLPP